MNLCDFLPILMGIIYHKYAPREPLKLMLLSWLTLALVSSLPCIGSLALQLATYVREIAVTKGIGLLIAILKNNLVVFALNVLLGPLYLGFSVTTTAMVARALASGIPWRVILGAHTPLELYAYSLATTREPKKIARGLVYLVIAALVESWFINKSW
ncbi:hypothetical protein IPA_09475 [Ignicoccus pacificus DSM 13166]|uniref:Uncharacterized protein n=1 Tax=Ignicoccus pacificus DSM 13166 TaxID=940294 RepID=A0A977KCR3_9CREN|nr:hypothetical protein IPA_09475 [Ignicoccus pacificus DSM 13166]